MTKGRTPLAAPSLEACLAEAAAKAGFSETETLRACGLPLIAGNLARVSPAREAYARLVWAMAFHANALLGGDSEGARELFLRPLGSPPTPFLDCASTGRKTTLLGAFQRVLDEIRRREGRPAWHPAVPHRDGGVADPRLRPRKGKAGASRKDLEAAGQSRLF